MTTSNHTLRHQALMTLALLGCSSAASAAVCFVTTTGVSGNSGASWSQSMDLVAALNATECDDIRVAHGVYKPPAVPTPGADLVLRPGVTVHGGFEGVPGSEDDFASRDPAHYPTVISGDIDNDDIVDANGVTVSHTDMRGSNRHLFALEPGDGVLRQDTVLDGFILTAASSHALQCKLEAAGECSPTLRNLVWSGNAGTLVLRAFSGGRLEPVIRDSTFRHNTAHPANFNAGGAVMVHVNIHGSAAPRFENVTFHGNLANMGGGVALLVDIGTLTATFDHVTLTDNSAGMGGAIAIHSFETVSSFELRNAIVWGNTAIEYPMFSITGNDDWARVRGSVLQSDCTSAINPMFCHDVVTSDPQLGPLQDNGGFTPTRMPGAGGSAIGGAELAYCLPVDQRGVTRPQGVGCDAGAVESTDPVFRHGFEG